LIRSPPGWPALQSIWKQSAGWWFGPVQLQAVRAWFKPSRRSLAGVRFVSPLGKRIGIAFKKLLWLGKKPFDPVVLISQRNTHLSHCRADRPAGSAGPWRSPQGMPPADDCWHGFSPPDDGASPASLIKRGTSGFRGGPLFLNSLAKDAPKEWLQTCASLWRSAPVGVLGEGFGLFHPEASSTLPIPTMTFIFSRYFGRKEFRIPSDPLDLLLFSAVVSAFIGLRGWP